MLDCSTCISVAKIPSYCSSRMNPSEQPRHAAQSHAAMAARIIVSCRAMHTHASTHTHAGEGQGRRAARLHRPAGRLPAASGAAAHTLLRVRQRHACSRAVALARMAAASQVTAYIKRICLLNSTPWQSTIKYYNPFPSFFVT